VPPPFLPEVQLVNANVELNAINENNFSFFIVDINIFQVTKKNKKFNKSNKDLIFLKNVCKIILFYHIIFTKFSFIL
jgi:hypothetical protein